MGIAGTSGFLAQESTQSCALDANRVSGIRRVQRMGKGKNRVSFDAYAMLIARAASSRSTCRHRKQGAVLTRDKRVLSTGYNGSPSGMPHCIDSGHCRKDEGQPCMAEGLHGESNAIASAAKEGISTNGATIYCVYSPCRSCCNLLKSAGIICVGYAEVYENFLSGPSYLEELGIVAVHLEESE